MAVGLLFGVALSGFLAPRRRLVWEQGLVFSTPCSGLCSGLKATREGPVGLTRMLLSVFLNSAVMFLFNPKVTFLELDGLLLSCMAGLPEAGAALLLAFRKNRGFGKKGVSNFTKSFSVLSLFLFRGLKGPLLPRAWTSLSSDSNTWLCSTKFKFNMSFIFFLFLKTAAF